MSDHTCPDCGALHPEKPMTLRQRIRDLEERVRALEARPQWSWTSTPTIYESGGTGDDTTVTINSN